MEKIMDFGDILEAADKLALEDQEALKEVLSKRIAQRRRAALHGEIREARREFDQGQGTSVSVDDLMAEIEL